MFIDEASGPKQFTCYCGTFLFGVEAQAKSFHYERVMVFHSRETEVEVSLILRVLALIALSHAFRCGLQAMSTAG